MDGQADTAPVTADDVAAFLLDNPDAAGAGDQEEVKPTADAPEGEEPEDNADAETDDEFLAMTDGELNRGSRLAQQVRPAEAPSSVDAHSQSQ